MTDVPQSSATVKPARAVTLITPESSRLLAPAEITPEMLGWKGFGLCCLPLDWAPPFVVVESKAIEKNDTQSLQQRLDVALTSAGVLSSEVIVRSSGTAETMKERGRLESIVCPRAKVGETIKNLHAKFGADAGQLHWIVQQHVLAVAKGHLSNERHLSREKRDWVAEFEISTRSAGYTTPVAIRRWRDGEAMPLSPLVCPSQLQVPTMLKQVALWGSQYGHRLHFEWVWDGKAVYVVQADSAEATGEIGVDPTTIRPPDVPAIALSRLEAFRPATPQDFEAYPKLHNAAVYRHLGYEMPPFFVLADTELIRGVLCGNVGKALASDLVELTRRPLIIRTDGKDIPPDRREMLPRSDELRNVETAIGWLTTTFKDAVDEAELASCELCLIAHHFIPSIAAAWARAEPNNRIVRIESLWGLPEGLYWYSHDTFEVDTQKLVGSGAEAAIRERLRFKGTFIAPDSHGHWVPRRTAPPHDWTRSISRNSWIAEIARTTRLVADRENRAIVLMWFIDNDHRATRHAVLPWYHTASELGLLKAAPRRKLSVSRDYRVAHLADWKELKCQLNVGASIERVVIQPEDPELIRSQGFAKELAKIAADNNIVVELAGGILSHAYYMLQRHGAQVECVDLFGAEDDILEFNKLVRDRIPDLIAGGGEDVETVRVTGDALITALRRKLVEEAFEALDAKSEDELIDELADVVEVIAGICNALHVPPEQLEDVRGRKRTKRGGFEMGLMLKRTSLPRSLSGRDESESSLVSGAQTSIDIPAISDASRIPASPVYRRVDLRHRGEHPERLVSFETELLSNYGTKEVAELRITLQEGIYAISAVIALSRNRASTRGTIRLRVDPAHSESSLSDSQLPIRFPESE